MKLLREFINSRDIEVIKEDIEVNGEKKKAYYLEGIMLQAAVKNRNGRIYPQEILVREVSNYVTEKVANNLAVGTLDHGETPNIDLDRISHAIVSLKMEGNNGKGKARLLDTPCGRIAKALVDEGIVLGMSTRGVGSLEDEIVQVDFQLLSIDLVNNPSAPKAFVHSVVESTDWILKGAKWVCEDGSCKLIRDGVVRKELNEQEVPEKIVKAMKKESVVEKAVKQLKEDVDRNASSKFMLEHMMNFIGKINSKK